MSALLDRLLGFFRHSPEAEAPEGLIAVLLDESAEYGDRDDAAKYLAECDDPAAEAALVQLVLDPGQDEDMADTAGEACGGFGEGTVSVMQLSSLECPDRHASSSTKVSKPLASEMGCARFCVVASRGLRLRVIVASQE